MRELPSGLVQISEWVTLLDGKKKRYFATGTDEAEAEKNLQEKVEKDNRFIKYGDALLDGKTKLFDAVESYLEQQKVEFEKGNDDALTDSSIFRDESAFNYQIKPCRKLNVTLDMIFPTTISMWVEWLNARCVTGTRKPLSADTKNRALCLLQKATDSYFSRMNENSPFRAVKHWRRKKKEVSTDDVLIEDEIAKVISFCNEHPSADADILMLQIMIYDRIGETLALKVKDYNPDARELSISRTVKLHNQLSEDGRCKTASGIRKIMVGENAHEILMRNIKGKRQDDLIFPSKSGGVRYESAFNLYLKSVLKACGIKKNLHTHSLRKTGISYSQFKGADVAAVSKNAGHKDIGVTLACYTAIYKEAQKTATAVMDNAMSELIKKAQ